MSLLMLVFSISPLLAPLTGSFVIQITGWRGVFWVVLGAAVIGFGDPDHAEGVAPQGGARQQQPAERLSLLPTLARRPAFHGHSADQHLRHGEFLPVPLQLAVRDDGALSLEPARVQPAVLGQRSFVLCRRPVQRDARCPHRT